MSDPAVFSPSRECEAVAEDGYMLETGPTTAPTTPVPITTTATTDHEQDQVVISITSVTKRVSSWFWNALF